MLPPLPFADWTESRRTVHLMLQIIGKVRLHFMPRKNHWWYITLGVTPRGLATGPIPYGDGMSVFEVECDLLHHEVTIRTSSGSDERIPLEDGLSVAAFYHSFCAALDALKIDFSIIDRPFDVPPPRPFEEITELASYDPDFADRYRRILIWIDGVFREFSGRFYGKTSPVQLFWHHMDLAVTRFSGRRAPAVDPAARTSDKDAYSHEVVSFGFWAGDENVPYPAFYSYTFPSPSGLSEAPLSPPDAAWVDSNGSPMALLDYESVRAADDPRETLLAFLESAYQAGAGLAGWDVADLTVPPLDTL